MFQIFENGKAVAKMQTREELFRYFIRRDLNIYICTTDRIMSYTPLGVSASGYEPQRPVCARGLLWLPGGLPAHALSQAHYDPGGWPAGGYPS